MSDRRPLGFWQPFNDWWRKELEKLGRRPNAQEIVTWYHMHAYDLWQNKAPSIQETRVHAKCLRSLPLVRDYFRSYRAKKRNSGSEQNDDDDGQEDDTAQGEDRTPTKGGKPKQARSEKSPMARPRRSGVAHSTQPGTAAAQTKQQTTPGAQSKHAPRQAPASEARAKAEPSRSTTSAPHAAAGTTCKAPSGPATSATAKPTENDALPRTEVSLKKQQELARNYQLMQQQQTAAYQQQLALAALTQQFAASRAQQLPPQPRQEPPQLLCTDGLEIAGYPAHVLLNSADSDSKLTDDPGTCMLQLAQQSIDSDLLPQQAHGQHGSDGGSMIATVQDSMAGGNMGQQSQPGMGGSSMVHMHHGMGGGDIMQMLPKHITVSPMQPHAQSGIGAGNLVSQAQHGMGGNGLMQLQQSQPALGGGNSMLSQPMLGGAGSVQQQIPFGMGGNSQYGMGGSGMLAQQTRHNMPGGLGQQQAQPGLGASIMVPQTQLGMGGNSMPQQLYGIGSSVLSQQAQYGMGGGMLMQQQPLHGLGSNGMVPQFQHNHNSSPAQQQSHHGMGGSFMIPQSQLGTGVGPMSQQAQYGMGGSPMLPQAQHGMAGGMLVQQNGNLVVQQAQHGMGGSNMVPQTQHGANSNSMGQVQNNVGIESLSKQCQPDAGNGINLREAQPMLGGLKMTSSLNWHGMEDHGCRRLPSVSNCFAIHESLATSSPSDFTRKRPAPAPVLISSEAMLQPDIVPNHPYHLPDLLPSHNSRNLQDQTNYLQPDNYPVYLPLGMTHMDERHVPQLPCRAIGLDSDGGSLDLVLTPEGGLSEEVGRLQYESLSRGQLVDLVMRLQQGKSQDGTQPLDSASLSPTSQHDGGPRKRQAVQGPQSDNPVPLMAGFPQPQQIPA